MLVTRFWMLVAGYWVLVTGWRELGFRLRRRLRPDRSLSAWGSALQAWGFALRATTPHVDPTRRPDKSGFALRLAILNGTYQFDVTVQHKDEGWKHYANKWDVVGQDGAVLGTRTLYHPHVEEQPFTRSLSGVKIPEGITKVTILAHDSVHKYGGKAVTVTLPAP